MATKEQEQHAKKRCVEADMEESQRIMGVTNRDHDGKEMMKDVELKASSLTNYEQKCAELEERLSIVMGNYLAVLASRDTVALENIVRIRDKNFFTYLSACSQRKNCRQLFRIVLDANTLSSDYKSC